MAAMGAELINRLSSLARDRCTASSRRTQQPRHPHPLPSAGDSRSRQQSNSSGKLASTIRTSYYSDLGDGSNRSSPSVRLHPLQVATKQLRPDHRRPAPLPDHPLEIGGPPIQPSHGAQSQHDNMESVTTSKMTTTTPSSISNFSEDPNQARHAYDFHEWGSFFSESLSGVFSSDSGASSSSQVVLL
ncbi:hypothetical protein ACLOJK_037271 [Asimina triloba]